jgi:hypothetical protein
VENDLPQPHPLIVPRRQHKCVRAVRQDGTGGDRGSVGAGENYWWRKVHDGRVGVRYAEGETSVIAAGYDESFRIDDVRGEGLRRALVDVECLAPSQRLGGRRQRRVLFLERCLEGPKDGVAIRAGREDGNGREEDALGKAGSRVHAFGERVPLVCSGGVV